MFDPQAGRRRGSHNGEPGEMATAAAHVGGGAQVWAATALVSTGHWGPKSTPLNTKNYTAGGRTGQETCNASRGWGAPCKRRIAVVRRSQGNAAG